MSINNTEDHTEAQARGYVKADNHGKWKRVFCPTLEYIARMPDSGRRVDSVTL